VTASTQDTEPVLSVRGLSTGYGSVPVVSEVSIDVARGELVALLGRNGAGKSTTLNAIAGARHGPTRGTVRLAGRDVTRAGPAALYLAGLALVPEGHRVFPSLSVVENVRLGGFPWRRKRARAIDTGVDRVMELFPMLARYATREAGALSGGQQQMVAIGQALVADPAVLMIDEPSSGLAPAVVADIYRALTVLRDEGRAVLLVEQSIDRAMAAATRTYVLERGSIVLAGPSAELRRDDRVAAIVRGAAVVDG
jgi:branched-chain amino acid transport system ATP-binding protein